MNKVLSEFIASHPFARTTARTYADILSRFLAEHPDPSGMSAAGLLDFVHRDSWGSSRQAVALSACKSFLSWTFGRDHPALSAKIKRTISKPQRALTPALALELLASFNPYTCKGSRDLAMASLMLDTGLRSSEICRLQQSDTDTDLRVLQVIVKGGQWKAAVFSEETAAHLERWKSFRQSIHPRSELFCNVLTGKGLTSEGLYNIIEAWGITIGVKLSPHDLRRSFATLATLFGAPERVLMEGGRWSNSEMIHRYTRTLKLDAMRAYLPVSKLKA